MKKNLRSGCKTGKYTMRLNTWIILESTIKLRIWIYVSHTYKITMGTGKHAEQPFWATHLKYSVTLGSFGGDTGNLRARTVG